MTPGLSAIFTISEPTVCPLPFVDVHGKYCFSVTLRKLSWAGAANLCFLRNAFLATIDTEEKNSKFTEYIAGKSYFKYTCAARRHLTLK